MANDWRQEIMSMTVDKTLSPPFKDILDQCSELICCHLPDGEYTYVNEASASITGYKPGDLLGKSPYDFFHPDDLDRIRESGHKPALSGDDSSIVEYRFRKKNGQYVWFQTTTRPVYDEEGKLLYLITTSRNINTLVKLRRKLDQNNLLVEEAAKLSKVGAWEAELYPPRLYWSKTAYQIHNVPYQEQPRLEDALSFFTPESQELVSKAFEKAIRSGRPYNLEVELIARGGERKWVRTIGRTQKRMGKVVKLYGVIQDISADVEQREQLRDLADFLSQKKMQLENFNQIVSHNLRAPVGNLTSLLKFYEESQDEQERETYISYIKESTENLNELLSDLVDAVKIMHSSEVEREELSLTATLEKIVRIFRGQILETEASVNLIRSDWDKLNYSEVYFESILTNLISNSLKYARHGVNPCIEIEALREGPYYLLKFRDNGCGIDLQKHGHKMFSLHRTFHPSIRGKGLGLFMTRQQIEAMGGAIEVESKPGQGTCFTIILNKYEV